MISCIFRDHYLSPEIYVYRENVSQNKPIVSVLDDSLRKEIEHFHQHDMELYRRATEMRNRRMNDSGQLKKKIKDKFSSKKVIHWIIDQVDIKIPSFYTDTLYQLQGVVI